MLDESCNVALTHLVCTEYQPYQKIDSSNSSTLSECHKDCDGKYIVCQFLFRENLSRPVKTRSSEIYFTSIDYQDCQAEDDHQRGCKEKTRKDNVSLLKVGHDTESCYQIWTINLA